MSRVTTFSAQIGAGAIKDSDLEILRRDEYAGANAGADTLSVRNMLLFNDQYNQYCQRAPREYVKRLADTTPGKSVLYGHDYDSVPVGRFFRASVVARDEESFPVLQTGKVRSRVFRNQPCKVNWLDAAWYFVNTPGNDDLRANLDYGVYRYVSIGFRYDDLRCDLCNESYFSRNCPHIMGVSYKEGFCTGTFCGEKSAYETLEGSIVYAGAVPGAVTYSDIAEGDPEKMCQTPWGADEILLKSLEFRAKGNDAEGRLHDGSRFAEHADRVLAQVGELMDRAEQINALRRSEDRSLSRESLQKLGTLKDRLAALLETKPAAVPEIERQRLMLEFEALTV